MRTTATTRVIELRTIFAFNLRYETPHLVSIELTIRELSQEHLHVHQLDCSNVDGVHLTSGGSFRTLRLPTIMYVNWV